MLKITRVLKGDFDQIKVEGKLFGPWNDELLHFCTHPRLADVRMHLDLSALSFADRQGIDVLRSLVARGAEITRCSGYVAELMRRENR